MEIEVASKHTSRFQFVDGLRGLAALAVVVPHAVGLFAFPNANWFSRLVMGSKAFGAAGVEVFFVVSGFAIAHSLRNADTDGFTLGRFVLRRAVRLDPPYWTGLLLFGAVSLVRALVTGQGVSLPGPAKVVAHLFYLQDLLGYGQFNVVCWTLCLELQLYIVFAIVVRIMTLSARLETDVDARRRVARRAAFLVSLFFLSLLLSHTLWPPAEGHGWFVPFFYLFLAGALGSWHKLGRVSDKTFLFCLALMGLGFAWSPSTPKLYGFLTAGAIYLATRRDALNRWLSGSTFQWLGRISYSIYLVHVPIVVLVMGLRARIAPNSNLVSLMAFAVVYALTLCVAHLFHLAIEVPSLRLSQRLKQPVLRDLRPLPPVV